jgi:hypothetical protein
MKSLLTPQSKIQMKFEHKYGYLTTPAHLDAKTKEFYDRIRSKERPFLQV